MMFKYNVLFRNKWVEGLTLTQAAALAEVPASTLSTKVARHGMWVTNWGVEITRKSYGEYYDNQQKASK